MKHSCENPDCTELRHAFHELIMKEGALLLLEESPQVVDQIIAAQLAAEAERAIRAEAQIHSPSRVSGKLGDYWAQGWINHILDKVRESRKAIKELIYIPPLPDIPTPSMAGAGGGSWDLKDEYEYSRNAKYTIVVPVEIDGKETARVTAPYTEAELDKRQKINNMINGKR